MSGPWTYTPFTSLVSISVVAASASDYASALAAWNEYETVEAADAATRSTAIGAGAPGSVTWYAFAGEGERRKYRDGLLMHAPAFPGTNWAPQRTLPLTPAQVSTLEVVVGTAGRADGLVVAGAAPAASDLVDARVNAMTAFTSTGVQSFTDLLAAREARAVACSQNT
jgi:hypothetical protein